MPLLKPGIIALILTLGVAFNAKAAETLFAGSWGASETQIKQQAAGHFEQSGTLGDATFLQYGTIIAGCQAGLIYQFNANGLYSVSISTYVYVETAAGMALIQKLTGDLQARLAPDAILAKDMTVVDDETQITHTGKHFTGTDTAAFIFAKIWPEEEGRQVIIMEFADGSSAYASRLPSIFADLFRR